MFVREMSREECQGVVAAGDLAQLERALIAERTKAGIKAAKARGKLPGNPGLRERRPEVIKAVPKAREKLYLDELIASAQM